jgi:hypothetical protein
MSKALVVRIAERSDVTMWQPIHLHANRFWFLATGHGDLNHCLGFKDYDDTRPVPHLDIINTLVRLFRKSGKSSL